MLRLLLLVGCLALLVAATGTALPSDAAKGPPALRLVDRQPVTLKGLRFKTRERVRLVVEAGHERRVRALRANASGSFVASFGSVVVDRCMGFRAVATGAKGSTASLKLPEPACPVP